jgi:hypothetical protein
MVPGHHRLLQTLEKAKKRGQMGTANALCDIDLISFLTIIKVGKELVTTRE